MLSSLLRHRGSQEGLDIGEDGYTLLSKVVAMPTFQAGAFTTAEILELVAEKDEKKRFQVCTREGELWIRASQGHTIRTVDDSKLLQRIESADEVPCCVHGTYLFAWPDILNSGGLSRMSRNHIHFAPRLPGAGRVISGMRTDAEVAVFVSVSGAIAAGIEFFRSANDVVLTRGDADGKVPLCHFERVLRLPDLSQLWPVAASDEPPPAEDLAGGTAATAAATVAANEGAPAEGAAAAARRHCDASAGGSATGADGGGSGDAGGGGAPDSESEEETVLLGRALLRGSL